MKDDWSNTQDDWQQGPRQEPTFRQDLGGFFFHVATIALIGSTAVYAWQTFVPQPVIQIQVEVAS